MFGIKSVENNNNDKNERNSLSFGRARKTILMNLQILCQRDICDVCNIKY